jgi:hypothetical protein
LPRPNAYIVHLFLTLRGFNGGCKDRHVLAFIDVFVPPFTSRSYANETR